MRKLAVISVTFFFAIPALADETIHNLSKSQEWLRLLHYKSNFLRGSRSAVDGSGFFFSENGARNPEAELEATIAAFKFGKKDVGKLKQPSSCAFPARFRFLNEKLHLGLKPAKCEKFDEFLQRFSASGVALVFSAAYPNNPASMFGHTFLRIHQRGKGDLLDNSLSYAAVVPPDENDFAFIWFGLTGGYPGSLSLVPYYVKVNEYSNSESRDLWEYELNLSPDQTWWLLANAWEIETNGYLDYFFFDENCSWLILTLLEAARPDWNISDFSWYTVPGETVKRVTRIPGTVKAVHYRPSLFKKMRQAVESLNDEDLQVYKTLLKDRTLIGKTTNAAALNAVLARLHYEKQKDDLSDERKAVLQAALLRRAVLKNPEVKLDPIPETSRVDLGHDASRFSVGASLRAYEFGWKSGYHELVNSDLGYSAFSEVNFPGITVRYNQKENSFFVSQIEGISIVSLQPVTEAVTPLSWKAHVLYDQLKDVCETCRAVRAEGGIGLSLVSRGEKNAVWTLNGLRSELSKHLERGARGFAFSEIGFGKSWNHTHKTVTIVRYLPRVFGTVEKNRIWESELTHSVQVSPQWEIRGSAEVIGPSLPRRSSFAEGKIQLNRYY